MGATISTEQLQTLMADAARTVFREEIKNLPGGGAPASITHLRISTGPGAEPEPKAVLGRVLRSLVANHCDPEAALKWHHKNYADKEAAMHDAVARAMAAGEASGGGYWLPDELSDQMTAFLRAKAVVRGTGVAAWPMQYGTLRVPKITSGSEASYIGENKPAPLSSVGAGEIILSDKKLACLVPISNDLMLYSKGQADNIVTNDLVNGMKTREDRAFLRGLGTQFTPRGIRYWALGDNVSETNDDDGAYAGVCLDAQELITALLQANIPMDNPWWFMAPRTKTHLMLNVRDGNGNLVFKDELSKGMWLGYPVAVTTGVPTNLGSGADETELMLADMADGVIGESTKIQIAASDVTAYVDDEDTTISAFQNDQTVIRAIARHDFCFRRVESIAVKTGIQWGVPVPSS